ncbi:MAG: rhodanese-like domain-containing protein [Salibacteraceae bacterium]
MYVEQMYTGCLAEAAYYIESQGIAAVIDPLRDPEPYLKKAAERGATIQYIFETHFHADFVSGHLDLARETGATIVYGPTAKTGYIIHEAKDGEAFPIGALTMVALHTPGHTPESTTWLLRDEQGADHAIFSGDTLFIGDVGRPDLAIKGDLTKEDLAGMLFDSLQDKIKPLADHVKVYPAHGAGSACGKNISSETESTVGDQRQNNYAMKATSREAFVKELTTGILPPPQYFPKNAMINKQGYDALEGVRQSGQKALSVVEVEQALNEGALLLDTRDSDSFHKEFIPGSVSIGLNGSFAVWVGTLITDLKRPIVLVADPNTEEQAVLRLARVGYDKAIGYLDGGISAWKTAGNAVQSIRSIAPETLSKELSEHPGAHLIDVRKPGEFNNAHIEHSSNFPLDFINNRFQDIDLEGTYYLHCKSGYRSVVAASIFRANGVQDVVNIEGGFDALSELGFLVVEPVA